MNNNHIIDWAEKCGINIHTSSNLPQIDGELVNTLKKFAEYSAKYERQLCAKICDSQAQDETESDIWTGCAKLLSKRIRARGQA